MDLEMTGLDPERHVVLEVATLVTDDDLALVAEGPDLVMSADPGALEAMEEPVVSMHERSGLTAAVRSSQITLEDAGRTTLEFIRAHVPEPGGAPLCGNSIGTDRRFLARHLPDIESYLHYRSIDVSTVKELCRRWYPEALAASPRKSGGHRAMADIRESVAELAYYRASVFRPPGTPGATDPPEPATD